MRKLVLKSSLLLGTIVIVGLIFPTLSRNYEIEREENQIFHRSNENTRITKDNVLDVVSNLDLITREGNIRQYLCIDELLFDLMVGNVSEINQDMFIHMNDDLLVDFMNFQFEVFNDVSDEILDVVRNDFSDEEEALRFFENFMMQEITELDESADYRARSNSLRMSLSAAGLSSASINVIVGAFNVVAATMRLRFTPNVVRGLLIGSALLVTTTVIILNWDNVGPIINAVTNEFINVARQFASTITNFFNNVISQARNAVEIFIVTVGGMLVIDNAIRNWNAIRSNTRVRVLTDALQRQLGPGYFPAIVYNDNIMVIPIPFRNRGLAVTTFVALGSSGGIYTPSQTSARQVARDAGGGRTPVLEPIGNISLGNFRHYHTFNRTPAGHAWFGARI